MTQEGFLPFRGYETWYRVAGDLSSDKTPLLCLHGGPGGTSDYFEPLEAIAEQGRPVIRYDQIGSGRSDRPSDPSLWTLATFVEEIAAVRCELGLERVHVLGQSWGGTLAIEYAASRPPGLAGIILYSAPVDWGRYREGLTELRAQLPRWAQNVMRRYEDSFGRASEPARATVRLSSDELAKLERQLLVAARVGSLRAMRPLAVAMSFVPPLREAAYNIAGLEFTKRFSCRVPLPASMLRGFAGMGREVYETMWGPSEFHGTGSLKDLDQTPRLADIEVPTLIVTGHHDAIRPADHGEVLAREIVGSEYVCFEEASHLAHFEVPDRFMSVLRDFLERADVGYLQH